MKYNLNLYTLTQVWSKTPICVEAESLDEAIKKVKDDDYESLDYEYLYETEEPIRYELEDKTGKIIDKW